jgi:predicted permease
MSSLLILILSFVAGIFIKKIDYYPEELALLFRKIIIYVCLPAVILEHIPQISWSQEALYPMAMPWLFFLTAALFFKILQKPLGFSKKMLGCLILMAGFGNTSFVGFPMIEAFYGKEALKIGVLVDQPGSFLLLSTVGLVTAVHFSGDRLSFKEFAGRVFGFLPFWFFILALGVGHLGLHERYPSFVLSLFHLLGALLSPLALLSIGLQIRMGHWQQYKKELAWGLSFKLLLGPVLMFGLLWGLWGGSGQVLQVTLFEAAMPPMVSAAILAFEHKIEPDVAALMIGVGIPLSFLTLPAVWYVLNFVG